MLLIAAGALAYANSLSVPFVFDDLQHIVEDRSIERLWPPSRVLGQTNRPVVKATLALNYALSGREVAGYHAVNVAIHVLAALTLFGVVRRTLRLEGRADPAAAGLAFAAALLWELHPLQTQAVTYVIQRAESLAGWLYLLTLYCAIRAAGSRRAGRWSAAAVASCALGMGTKEVVVTAPLAVALYDRVFLARARWPLYLGLAATWGVLLAVSGLEQIAREGSSAGFGLEAVGPLEYARTQPLALLQYLRLAVWPHALCFDYGWLPAPWRQAALPALGVSAALVACGRAVWRRSRLGFAGAWFFLVLAPTSSLIPIDDLVVEHRMYLALASLTLLAALGGRRLLERAAPGRRGLGAALLAVLALALGGATWHRNRDYRSPASLWASVVEVAPDNPRGHQNLARALQAEGRLDAAIAEYREALRVNPEFHARRPQGTALVHHNLGEALAVRGDVAGALRHLGEAMRLRPDWAPPLNNEAWILATHPDAQVRDPERALELARRASELSGGANPNILDTLAAAWAATGRFDRAVATAERALDLASQGGARDLAAALRARLALYRRGSPYREPAPSDDA